MELTFGALLGLAYGACAWRNRDSLPPPREPGPPRLNLQAALALAALAVAVAMLSHTVVHSRFNYTIAGALLLSVALYSKTFCWQTGITLTYCAFAFDLLRNKPGLPQIPLWIFVVASTLAVALLTARKPRMRPMFLLIAGTAVGMSLLKCFVPLVSLRPVTMEAVFLVQAALITFWALQRSGPVRFSAP